MAAGVALAAFRHIPALDEARALRTDLEGRADRVREAGLDIDRATIDTLEADLASAREHLEGRGEAVSGGNLAPATSPAVIEDRARRTVIGTCLEIPPGSTSLRYAWTSPYVASADLTGSPYRLSPGAAGLDPGRVTITGRVPNGCWTTAASPELSVVGGSASLSMIFEGDIVVVRTYTR